uniref:Uncharacterized protein n=1 Tax=Anguilla anguilla TaxID=7936 RepID=A0A0E9RHU6_ANGAN
MHLFVTVH